jgi:hypothetical protein
MKIYCKLKVTSQDEVSSESGERSHSHGDVGLRELIRIHGGRCTDHTPNGGMNTSTLPLK